MFKKFFSLVLLCAGTKLMLAQDVLLKNDITKNKAIELKRSIIFSCKKSFEFEKLYENLSPKAKTEFDLIINKASSLVDDPEVLGLIKKYDTLYQRFKNFRQREPHVILILSVEDENPLDFVSQDTQTFGEFTKILSEEELKELDDADSEGKIMMLNKAEELFTDLENSNLLKELKEKSFNKIFSSTALIF